MTRSMEWVKGGLIGTGSFADVSLGVSIAGDEGNRLMAVKSASTLRSSSLRKEKEILDDLQGCPQIITCIGDEVEEAKQVYNLFLEYIPGGSLADHLKRSCGKLPEIEVQHITRSVLRALRFIHAKGYVHCDMKLQNILLSSPTEVKVADFGLAKRSGEKAEFRGTPLYMAPESVSCGEYEAPSDVWSLGCAVTEMITGRPAWKVSDTSDVAGLLFRIGFRDEVPEISPQLSGEARDFLSKCFIRDPTQRWTVEMLLEHPFVAGETEEIVVDGASISSKKLFESPRSALDFLEWSSQASASLLPTESSAGGDVKLSFQYNLSPKDRIRQLASSHQHPNWSCSSSDGWICARAANFPVSGCELDSSKVDKRYFDKTVPEINESRNHRSGSAKALPSSEDSMCTTSHQPSCFSDGEAGVCSTCPTSASNDQLAESRNRICKRVFNPNDSCNNSADLFVSNKNSRSGLDCFVSSECKIDVRCYH